MTEDERIAWGREENIARQFDIDKVKSGAISLEKAQANARKRALQSGMTPSQAHRALVDAQRMTRRISS